MTALTDKSIKTTGLTSGEAALAKMVFGPQFNTNAIQKSYVSSGNAGEVCTKSNREGTVVMGCVIGRRPHIFMSEPSIFIDDFSRDGATAHPRAFVFFHEMTHVWQGMTNESEEGCDLDPDDDATPKPFDDYCAESQGNLVGRYIATYLMPNPVMQYLRDAIAETPADVEKYRKMQQQLETVRNIIETRFPHARQYRLRQEANVAALISCEKQAGTDVAKDAVCNRRFYVNPMGEPLTTKATNVTFTLPDGRVTRPAVKLDPALIARR